MNTPKYLFLNLYRHRIMVFFLTSLAQYIFTRFIHVMCSFILPHNISSCTYSINLSIVLRRDSPVLICCSVQLSWGTHAPISLWCTPKVKIVESWDKYIFNLIDNIQIGDYIVYNSYVWEFPVFYVLLAFGTSRL